MITTMMIVTTKESYTWNIAHSTESAAMRTLKLERWGSPLVQEKYSTGKKRPVTRDIKIK